MESAGVFCNRKRTNLLGLLKNGLGYFIKMNIFKRIFPAKSSPDMASDCPKIVIYGQYKTGTTACFFKIRNSLKSAPREIFEKPEFIPDPMDKTRPVLAKVIIPAKPENFIRFDMVLSQKELEEKAEEGIRSFSNFDKQILLIRDPRDRLISGILFLTQEHPEIYKNKKVLDQTLDLIRKKENSPSSVSLLEILNHVLIGSGKPARSRISEQIKNQHDWIFNFERKLKNFVKYRYEDMIIDNDHQVEKYLGFNIQKNVTVNKDFDFVTRTKDSGSWHSWFTEEDVEFFKPVMHDYIHHFGYDEQWKLNAHQQINPEHGSRYVERIINRRINLNY
jgi:predicted DNA-binding protein YlxM (UPF0122 family)